MLRGVERTEDITFPVTPHMITQLLQVRIFELNGCVRRISSLVTPSLTRWALVGLEHDHGLAVHGRAAEIPVEPLNRDVAGIQR